MSVSVAVFASGGGSNFQSILDFPFAHRQSRIVLLISDRPDIGALERAEGAGIPSRIIPYKDRTLEEVGEEMLSTLQEHEVRVVLLAGFLRLIPPAVVKAFRRRILNIHPALLPSFGGKGMWGHHVHEAVLDSGAVFSGPTVHFVDEEYDTGSILAQWPVPVLTGDTPDTLAARVLRVEHVIYPLAAEYLCRAVAEGKEVTRPFPRGEAFGTLDSFSTDAVAQQIEAAFQGPRD